MKRNIQKNGMFHNSKTCNICLLLIQEHEHYCVLSEYVDKKLRSTGYYHVACYKNKFIVPNRALQGLLKNSNAIFEKIGINPIIE